VPAVATEAKPRRPAKRYGFFGCLGFFGSFFCLSRLPMGVPRRRGWVARAAP